MKRLGKPRASSLLRWSRIRSRRFFLISGTAAVVDDQAWIDKAFVGLSDPDPSRYVVFELDLQDVKVTVYEGENTVRRRWRAAN
jgi:hypothetical protein